MRIHSFDPNAPKKSANLSINSDLLRQARELQINLSQTLEQRLAEIIRHELGRRWQEENRGALEDYNGFLERNGTFGDEWRTF